MPGILWYAPRMSFYIIIYIIIIANTYYFWNTSLQKKGRGRREVRRESEPGTWQKAKEKKKCNDAVINKEKIKKKIWQIFTNTTF